MEKLTLNDSAIFYLSIIRKWAKFIAVFMFVMIGLMVLAGLFMGLIMNTVSTMAAQTPLPFPGQFFAVFYILMALVYFFPVFYLYRFSEYLGRALYSGSEEELTTAFRYLKSHYNFIGVLLIISLAIIILALIAAIFAGIFGFMAMKDNNSYF